MHWGTLTTVLVVGVVISEAQAYQESEDTNPVQSQKSDTSDTWSRSSKVDTTFEFSNSKRICLEGWMDLGDGNLVYSDTVLRDCDTEEELGYCQALGEGCHIWFRNDTLWMNQHELLAMGENLELVKFPWKIEAFYLEDGSIRHTERMNENLRYDEQTIESILKEYETTKWLTQEEDNQYVGFQLMPLANKLLIAAISGSQESELRFKEFRTKVKPDGAYASWYIIMERILKYAGGN